MSFMDDLSKLASGFLGGASPQQAADAASTHVQSMDPNDLAGHLTQSLPGMDASSLQGLGAQLLSSFTQHPAGADGAAAAAGTSADAVASGDPGAVGMLVNYAKQHPEILQNAASSFMQKNPGAIGQLAPGLLQGIMGRLGGLT